MPGTWQRTVCTAGDQSGVSRPRPRPSVSEGGKKAVAAGESESESELMGGTHSEEEESVLSAPSAE